VSSWILVCEPSCCYGNSCVCNINDAGDDYNSNSILQLTVATAADAYKNGFWYLALWWFEHFQMGLHLVPSSVCDWLPCDHDTSYINYCITNRLEINAVCPDLLSSYCHVLLNRQHRVNILFLLLICLTLLLESDPCFSPSTTVFVSHSAIPSRIIFLCCFTIVTMLTLLILL